MRRIIDKRIDGAATAERLVHRKDERMRFRRMIGSEVNE